MRLRYALATLAVVLIGLSTSLQAQQTSHFQYLPYVVKTGPTSTGSQTPTASPTSKVSPTTPASPTSNVSPTTTVSPEPVNLESLIIQPDAMPAGYTITDQRQLGGNDGRVSDYFRRYNNGDIQSSASDVAHQVILYKSVEDANRAFTSLVDSQQSAGFQEMNFGKLSTDRQIALHKVDGPVTIQAVVMREGNYIIIVQTLAKSTASDRVTVLRQYVDKALDRFNMFFPI